MNQTIQAIIVDDHSIFRKGIKMTLERIPNIKVIAEANNGLEFLQLLNMQTPDVVLMDYLMPEMDGIEAASQALQKNPQLKIISMTMMNNEFYLTRMLKAGIKGIIPKNTSKFELTEAIHKVVVGEDYISKTYNMHLIHNHLKSKTMTTTKKVLIVDDDIDVITMMEAILKKANFDVITASNKEEGLEKAKTEQPGLAILDVMMNTHFEGFELAKTMKDTPELKNIPVLMQTSIDVLTTTRSAVQELAREYRAMAKYQELDVLLVKDINSGKAGIDYRSEEGKNIWLPVEGFIKKPVSSEKIMPEVSRFFNN